VYIRFKSAGAIVLSYQCSDVNVQILAKLNITLTYPQNLTYAITITIITLSVHPSSVLVVRSIKWPKYACLFRFCSDCCVRTPEHCVTHVVFQLHLYFRLHLVFPSLYCSCRESTTVSDLLLVGFPNLSVN
jgi:hypothetical protein